MTSWIFPALLLLFVVSTTAFAEGTPVSDPLVVVKGRVIEITGSNDLLDRSRGVEGAYPALGCSYKIEWGDGLSDPPAHFPKSTHCQSGLRHVYERPGQYRLRITTQDPDPLNSDKTINKRRGETLVTIR